MEAGSEGLKTSNEQIQKNIPEICCATVLLHFVI